MTDRNAFLQTFGWSSLLQCPRCGGAVAETAGAVVCSRCSVRWPSEEHWCRIGGDETLEQVTAQRLVTRWRSAGWLGDVSGESESRAVRGGSPVGSPAGSPEAFAERLGVRLTWQTLPLSVLPWGIWWRLRRLDGLVLRAMREGGLTLRERSALVAATWAGRPSVIARPEGTLECLEPDAVWRRLWRRLVAWYRLPPLDRLIRRARDREWARCNWDRRWAERWVRRYLAVEPSLVAGWRIFDLGCGQGRHLALVGQLGASGVGLDRSPSGTWRQIPSATFLCGGAEDLDAVRGGAFDGCVAVQVLMYLEDDRRALQHLRRLLVRGGRLFVQVTHAGNLRTRLTGRWLRDDEPVRRYYRRDQIERLLRQTGFRVERVWMERVYAPWWTGFWSWLLEVVLPEPVAALAERLTPPSWRGLVTILARAA